MSKVDEIFVKTYERLSLELRSIDNDISDKNRQSNLLQKQLHNLILTQELLQEQVTAVRLCLPLAKQLEEACSSAELEE